MIIWSEVNSRQRMLSNTFFHYSTIIVFKYSIRIFDFISWFDFLLHNVFSPDRQSVDIIYNDSPRFKWSVMIKELSSPDLWHVIIFSKST